MNNDTHFYQEFISNRKSLLIAPAGYGKTYTISECLLHAEGTQLILTHTHAGISSIKTKVSQKSINCKYQIETIASFAQKYVDAFYCGNDKPEKDDGRYFPFVLEKANSLLKLKLISKIIRTTYSNVFVDEYQDCTLLQHKLILALSHILPTHLLGDPLQGIFDFNGDRLVDFEKDLNDFQVCELQTPWRWKNKNEQLGEYLKQVRSKLIRNDSLDLKELNNICNCACVTVNESDILKRDSFYRECLNKLIYNPTAKVDFENILFITSDVNIWQRVRLNQQLGNKLKLLEAFDDKDFLRYARKIDALVNSKNFLEDLITILKGKQSSGNGKRKTRSGTILTGLSAYMPKDNVLPKTRKKEFKLVVDKLKKLNGEFSLIELFNVFNLLINLNGVSCVRTELFYSLCDSMKLASRNSITVFEAMQEIRNVKRRVGRRVKGKFLGTTLLTKGLEFDTVVILNAHKIRDKKSLYVALTRPVKRLIVFTEREILSPN